MQPILGCLTSLQTLTAHEQTAKIAANLNDNANCSLVCCPPLKVPAGGVRLYCAVFRCAYDDCSFGLQNNHIQTHKNGYLPFSGQPPV